jgi:diaminopimelate epimerase
MMTRFTKMHGLGNDFVVFDGINQDIKLSTGQLQRIADRHFGIGCDQILIVEKPTDDNMDFMYRIFNADGGEVSQCGNGARCFMQFVRDQGLTDKDEIGVQTGNGHIFPRMLANGLISVNMGVPDFEPASIPYNAVKRETIYELSLGSENIRANILSLGNPHAVIQVDDIDIAPVTTTGAQIEQHPDFPERVNAGFMQVIDRAHIAVRVFERGSGETLACGSGACAAVIAGIQNGLLDTDVSVSLKGGDLEITWEGEGNPVWLTGPATTVFEGSIDLGLLKAE